MKTLASNPLAAQVKFCNYEELNSLKISHDEFPMFLDAIKSLPYINEVSLISTCNRFEIYCFGKDKFNESQIEEVKSVIRSINRSDVELSTLRSLDAELNFLRTFCGINSSLIGEDEISLQINISFKQSHTMGYLADHGMNLLNKALEARSFFDREIYSGKVSYCGISMQKSIEKLDLHHNSKVVVLGSGSTAYQAIMALIRIGIPAANIHLLHRISSSSNQIAMFKKNPLLMDLKYSRTKYGYHTQKAKDIVYHNDLVIFGIDSKNPVLHFPKDSRIKVIDFNSKPSCTFDNDWARDKYLSGKELDEFVRDYSKRLLQNPSFQAKLELGNQYLITLTQKAEGSRLITV